MPRVLLVEDQLLVAQSIIQILEVAGAIRVDWAPLATSARVHADEADYDIVVSDFALGFSQPTGVDLISELRARQPDATFVIVSSQARAVPDWASFVAKTDVDGLEAIITAWRR